VSAGSLNTEISRSFADMGGVTSVNAAVCVVVVAATLVAFLDSMKGTKTFVVPGVGCVDSCQLPVVSGYRIQLEPFVVLP